MTVYPRVPKAVARSVVYPLKEAPLRRQTLGVLAQLEASERLSRDDLLQLQARRLRGLVQHAYEHVPYYRKLFEEQGLDPQDVQEPADLARVPVLTKEIIRLRRAELTAPRGSPGYIQMRHSSGTTGEPVAVPGDALELSYQLANQLRGKSWHGIEIGDPEVRVLLTARQIAGSSLASKAFWGANAFKEHLLNIRVVGGTDLADEDFRRWERVVRRARPSVLYGLAASIYFFARFLRERSASSPPPRVRTVIVTSEKILPPQKDLISEVFGARVIEEYGSAECGVLAYECPEGRLHTSDESVVLEVPDPGPDGTGRLLVTSLTNRVMPLIRYQLGDSVALGTGSCPCGRPLGLMSHVVGRTADCMVDAGGNAVHPLRFVPAVGCLEAIERYRIVQTAVGVVELHVQATRELTADEISTIVPVFREALGNDVELRIRYFSTLAPGPGGKYRFLSSLVHQGERPGG